MSTAKKRVIIRLAIASAFAVLAVDGLVLRSTGITWVIAPAVTVVSGLVYLHSVRGRS